VSYGSLARQINDFDLNSRIDSAGQQEAWENAAVHDSAFAVAVRQGSVQPRDVFAWPVALNSEDAYETAVLHFHSQPGLDPAVVSDAMILAAVQANWPAQWPPPPAGP
jgi:hypothetical protein